MAGKNVIVEQYARMWPREVFDCLIPSENGSRRRVILGKGRKGLELVNEPGVYVLYRDDIPYYIGQAQRLRHRLWSHAGSPGARYGNFWNYFSAFVIRDPKMRDEVEGILIAAMPTANSAKPKLKRAKYPLAVSQLVRRMRKYRANPPV
jgi:hypothetical protein